MGVAHRMRIERPRAPFGSRLPRFAAVGFHPKFETRTGTYKYPNIFPGCHDWVKPPKIVSKISSWKRSLQVEEFSRRLGYHGDHIVKQRKWEKSINGPGWQEVQPVPSVRKIVFAKQERFGPVKSKASTNVPGPGTYGKNHDPYTRKEEKTRAKGFSYSVVPPFETAKSRPASLDPQPSYHLPPNIYKIKTATQELLDKRISKRGPYDLFTGPRFQRLVASKRMDLKEIVPRRIDLNDWNHPKNLFKGKFMKCGKESAVTTRIFARDPAATSTLYHPAPNYYDPYPAPVVAEANFPFNSSVMEARPVMKKTLLPPPGRYNPVLKRRIKGDGLRSAFISKTKRTIPQMPKWSWFK